MKRQINLEKAADAEVPGALAGRRHCAHRVLGNGKSQRTPAQMRALGDLLSSLLEFAREVGAERRSVKVGNVSLQIKEQGAEEVLSVRRLVPA